MAQGGRAGRPQVLSDPLSRHWVCSLQYTISASSVIEKKSAYLVQGRQHKPFVWVGERDDGASDAQHTQRGLEDVQRSVVSETRLGEQLRCLARVNVIERHVEVGVVLDGV